MSQKSPPPPPPTDEAEAAQPPDEAPPDPGTFDASDPSKVAERKSKAKRLEASRLNGLRQVLGNADSRHWLWDLLEEAGVFHTSMQSLDDTAMVLAFREGKRTIGLKVIAEVVKMDGTAYLTMVKENEARNG